MTTEGVFRQGRACVLALFASAWIAPLAASQTIPAGSEYGTYCSGTWSTGGWAFVSSTTQADVCASIASTGGTINRKGLYKNNDWNRVVARCYPPDYGWVVLHEGVGNDPLTAAFQAANAAPFKPGCIFTVSPTKMPILDAPFPLTASYSHATGVDLARPPYGVLNVYEFGQVGLAAAPIVDWKGRDMSQKDFIDNHAGHDWNMPRFTPIYAAADGIVEMARDFESGYTTSDSSLQKEVAIIHKVCGKNGYCEKFMTYYAHLSVYSVSKGQTVSRGQPIGLSGNTGSSTGPHLHFGVIRLTNTADQREETVTFDQKKHSDAGDKLIEPYGWAAPKGFDPWAWRGYPSGALSVDLWNAGQAPSTGSW